MRAGFQDPASILNSIADPEAKINATKWMQQLELEKLQLESEKRQLESEKRQLESEKRRLESEKQRLESEIVVQRLEWELREMAVKALRRQRRLHVRGLLGEYRGGYRLVSHAVSAMLTLGQTSLPLTEYAEDNHRDIWLPGELGTF
jgi:hypothetical protein